MARSNSLSKGINQIVRVHRKVKKQYNKERLHEYSVRRRAIMSTVRSIERGGGRVPEKYQLPKASEVRKMTVTERSNLYRRVQGYTKEKVKASAYVIQPNISKKDGKIRQQKVSYATYQHEKRKASAKRGAETRRRRKQEQESERKLIEDLGSSGNYYDVPDETPYSIATPKPEVDEDFERWAQDFIDSAPLDDRLNAEAYVDALREGDVPDDINGYDEWLESIGEEPSSDDYLSNVLDTLDQVNPSVADYLRGEVDKYKGASPKAFEERFREKEGNLPELNDILGSPRRGSGDISVNYGAIANLMKIITGKSSLSGAQMRAIGKALEQDDYE